MKKLSIASMILCLQGCATAFAVADVAGATVVYAGKTVVNTIDAVTIEQLRNFSADELKNCVKVPDPAHVG